MELKRICRQHALQCFEWAARIEDASQHAAFTAMARQWLATATEVEARPAEAQQLVASRLH